MDRSVNRHKIKRSFQSGAEKRKTAKEKEKRVSAVLAQTSRASKDNLMTMHLQ